MAGQGQTLLSAVSEFALPWARARRPRRPRPTKCSGEARFLFGARRANPHHRRLLWSRSAKLLRRMIKCERCCGSRSPQLRLWPPTRSPEKRQTFG